MSKDHADIVNSVITSTDHWVYGFTQVDNGIIDHPDLDIYDKMVYITIKRMINQQESITFPSYDKIGKVAGCSRRKAIDVVKKLIKLDLIENLGQHVEYGSNVYMVKRIQESKVLADPEKNKLFMSQMGIHVKPKPPKPQKEDKPDKQDPIPYREIIDYLNEQAGTKYNHTGQANQKLIKARYNELLQTGLDHLAIVWEFKNVIDVKTSQWKGSDMSRYLRPSTLFGNKFDQYRNERPDPQKIPTDPGKQPPTADWKKKFMEEGEEG